jgi:AraC-like DNA-binding protein
VLETFVQKIDCTKKVTEHPLSSIKVDFHLHDEYEIMLFLSGGLRYFIEKKSYDLVPGDILLMRPGEIHKPTFTTDDTYERIVCSVPGDVFSKLSTEKHTLDNCFTKRPHGEKNRLNSTDDEKNELSALFEKLFLLGSIPQPWRPQLILATFIEIMVKINRISADETRSSPSYLQHRKLKPILDYIDTNLENELSLDTLQKKFYITGSYLCQIFKQTTGSTLHEYIVYKRISRAKQLLLKGESASHASYKSGFSDYSNFVRAFRKVTGYSPREYLKKTLS